jgi:hypothetical protein
MKASIIQKILRRVPFRPFVIFLDDGSQYEIPHPEFVFVGKRITTIGISFNSEEGKKLRYTVIDNDHVSQLVYSEPENSENN